MAKLFNATFVESIMSAIEYLETPIGWLEIKASDKGITHIIFIDTEKTSQKNSITEDCKNQLKDYFASRRKVFDLPLDVKGTEFQKSVWQQLSTIPFGVSCSYRDIAEGIKNPKAVRAVGAANARNPISIVVPCHRVIGVNGTLTGYAGGLKRKEWLLKHEGLLISKEAIPLDC